MIEDHPHCQPEGVSAHLRQLQLRPAGAVPDLARRCFPEARAVEFYFVALERKSPHGICVFKASEGLLANCRQKMAKALDLFAQCTELDYWPSYDPVVHELDMPAWARHEEPVLEAAF